MIPSRLFALPFVLVLFHGTAHADALAVSGAWVREGPPTAQVLAGYMRIHNPGDSEAVISGAESPQFAQVEIHRTEVVDGVARMLPQDRLVIPAGGSIVLEPGGLHLMLIQPKRLLQQGDIVDIGLHLNDGCTVVEAEVRRGADAGEDQNHHH